MSLIHLTVTEFNEIMTTIIHDQLQLSRLCIRGEITQFNFYSEKKHLYLTIKHKQSSLQCVIYNQHIKDIPVIKQGDACEIIGQCRYLKNKGQLIFSGVKLIKSGTGKSRFAFEKQKKQMAEKGVFNIKKETDIPSELNHICIITAKDSAAFHDIESILSTHDHTFKTSVIPATMQGLLGASSIQDAIKIAISLNPDIICISRGGGAEEDFSCYNETPLTNAIIDCNIPIITGIGHQINTTLSCLCSNRYFETPTALAQFLCTLSMEKYNSYRDALQNTYASISTTLETLANKSIQIQQNFTQLITHNTQIVELKTDQLIDQLSILNPINTLKKGYVHCSNKQKKPISTIKEIKENEHINLHFFDGTASALIKKTNPH